MPMPKTSMHEDNLAAPWENNIRTAWQVFLVKPVTITHRMNETPNGQFGAGVTASNQTHSLASFTGAERIRHRLTVISN